ncbi:MAG: hypothetical protein HDR03_08395 [Lachnospiraceae bacterium]|nr:hypothetical protein [Lachnospiraceae bacterium]
MTYDEILTYFQVNKRYQDKAQCKCPAHDDKQASLTVTKGHDSVLIHCHANCSIENVLSAAGLKMSDLFYQEKRTGSSWQAYIESREKKKIEAVYNYVSINGGYAFTKVRMQGKKMLYGILENERFTYGLRGQTRKELKAVYGSVQAINKAISEGKPIFIPEGEKDVDTLIKHGYTAFSYGGVNDWAADMAQLCKGAVVYVLADNDEPGRRVANTIQSDLQGIAKSAKVIVPVPETPKADISDYFAAGHSKEEFESLLQQETVTEKSTEGKTLDLSQFHLVNNKGVPTGVFDEAIFKYIKRQQDLFVCGGTVYIYGSGYFKADSSGARLKTMISKLIYPQFIKSTTLKRIYDRFLCDISLEVPFEELNCYPAHWICFENGMYDCKEKRLLPHSPKYKAINQIPHEYKPDAVHEGKKTEEFLNFICPEPDSREMLLQFSGYAHTKDVGQQKFLVLLGEGGSGKSTFIRLMESSVGSRNLSNISLTDLQQRFASFGLMGKVLNSCADLEISALEDTAIIKKVLGEDTLRAEQKGHDAISFKNYAKLIFSTNELPVVKAEKTNGFYRRLLVLPMNRVPEKKNPNLLNELLQEIDYFVWLSVQALERMYEKEIIVTSAESEKAVAQLRMDSDTVQAFLVEECVLDDGSRIERTDLYRRYEKYCEDTDRQSLTKNNFYKSLRVKGYKDFKTGGYRYFKGISDEKSCPTPAPKTAPDGFVSISEGYQEELPFD